MQSEAQMKCNFRQSVFLKRITSTCGTSFLFRFSFISFCLLQLVQRHEAASLCLKNACYCICVILKRKEHVKSRSFLLENPRAPRPAPDANERDVAWCAGCWRSGAATPCSRFASLPGQASWVQPRQRQMFLCHSRWDHLTSDMLRFYEWNILWSWESSGMWRCLILWEVVAVSEESNAFRFRERQSPKIFIYRTWSSALSDCRVK